MSKECDSLINALNQTRERINQSAKLFTVSEGATRYALIDPILRALGWEVNDPHQVIAECPPTIENHRLRNYRQEHHRVDYALLDDNGMPFAIVEAKRFMRMRRSLGPRFREQIVSYYEMSQRKVKYALVTDGDIWRVLDLSVFNMNATSNESDPSIVLQVAVTDPDTDYCIRALRRLVCSTLQHSRMIDPLEFRQFPQSEGENSISSTTIRTSDSTLDRRFNPTGTTRAGKPDLRYKRNRYP